MVVISSNILPPPPRSRPLNQHLGSQYFGIQWLGGLFSKNKQLKIGQAGFGAIETAFLLPVFVLLVVGIIEFGLYFVRRELVTRSVSSASQAIQRNPSDATIATLARNTGSTLVNYSATGNFICAQAYTTQANANAGTCNGTTWNVANPNGPTSNIPYFVRVQSRISPASVTPVANFIPNFPTQITDSAIIQVGSIVPATACNPPNVLSWNGTNYVCNVVPNCSPGQIIKWYGVGSGFGCTEMVTSDCEFTAWSGTNEYGAQRICADGYVGMGIQLDWFPSGDADAGRLRCCKLATP